MAILHRATITPTKIEAVELWLDAQPWGGSGEIERIGSYRFDDPEGEVGVEALLVRRAGRILQVAMTYRGAPFADAHLITTMEHSTLGPRWVYEASTDPVAVDCFRRALAGSQEQAALEVYDGDQLVAVREQEVRIDREPGDTNMPGDLRIARALDEPLDGVERLTATWSDGQAIVAVR